MPPSLPPTPSCRWGARGRQQDPPTEGNPRVPWPPRVSTPRPVCPRLLRSLLGPGTALGSRRLSGVRVPWDFAPRGAPSQVSEGGVQGASGRFVPVPDGRARRARVRCQTRLGDAGYGGAGRDLGAAPAQPRRLRRPVRGVRGGDGAGGLAPPAQALGQGGGSACPPRPQGRARPSRRRCRRRRVRGHSARADLVGRLASSNPSVQLCKIFSKHRRIGAQRSAREGRHRLSVGAETGADC